MYKIRGGIAARINRGKRPASFNERTIYGFGNKGAEISARNEKYLRHLQGLVQILSVSSVNDEHTDWSRFDELHQYLQTTYPMIYQKLELTVIGKASLLFRWPSEIRTGSLSF